MTLSQEKMADDDVDDVVLAAASFSTCMILDSNEFDVGDSGWIKNAFVVHAVSGFTIREGEVSKASVSLGIACSYHIGVARNMHYTLSTCSRLQNKTGCLLSVTSKLDGIFQIALEQ
jgi:hypothetical protein